jgi:hypothetical protein
MGQSSEAKTYSGALFNEKAILEQGDKIGRMFAQWVIGYFEYCF